MTAPVSLAGLKAASRKRALMDQLEMDQRAFVQSLPLLVNAADKLKLHATARLLDNAQSVAGFELAEIIEKARKVTGSWPR